MKNTLKILLIIFVLFIYASVPNANANKKTYINGFDADYHPFSYINKEGKLDGFDIAAINWIAKEMGFEVKPQELLWHNIIPALLAKEIDLVVSGMSITPERQNLITFSNPYLQMHKVYLTRNDSTLDISTIQNTKIRLGVQRGTNDAEIAQKNIHEKNYCYSLRFYKSASLAIKDLVLGRIQAVALDNFPAKDYIARGNPLKIAGKLGLTDNVGVAMRHEDKELHALINEGYKRLMADPYWEELQKKYLREE